MKLLLDSALLLRRRSVWEAADSGILLWRHNFSRLMLFFALPFSLTAFFIRLLPIGHLFISIVVLWWLRPLFDRLALYVVSSRFFYSGEGAQQKPENHLVSLWEMRRGLLGDLLWRRFSPNRSAHMPIRILEHARGEQFLKRKKTLSDGGLHFCSLITLLSFLLERFLLLSFIVFAEIVNNTFLPAGVDLWNNTFAFGNFVFVVFCLMYILAGSLYVCTGFSLYINSRVEVEGWDLQLLFRKFSLPSPVVKKSSVHAILLCLFLFLPKPAHSEESVQAQIFPLPEPHSLEILETILDDAEFGGARESWGIRFRERETRAAPEPQEALVFPQWLEGIRQALGYILRFIAVVAIASLTAFAAYWFWKTYAKKYTPAVFSSRNYASPFFSRESPQALFRRAQAFHKQGNIREAWATCLSGCIMACVKYRALSFHDNATEYDCLNIVRTALYGEAEGFEKLVRNWVLFAYGASAPGEGCFEEALFYGHSLLKESEQAVNT
ncbi:MAG: hypothetical protein LBG93_00455 [Treponema sp.]|nr:hypothetical protein [Treponema sp.]